MKPFKAIYVDTETTGLDCKINEVVQIGAVVEINGNVVDEINLFMRPVKLANVSAAALKVQNRTLQQLKAFPPRKDGFLALKKVLNQHVNPRDNEDKFVWIGQNAPFDRGFVQEFFREFNDATFSSYFDYHSADLIALAVAMRQRGLFVTKNLKLTTMAEQLGIAYEAHDALADAQTLRRIWLEFASWIEGPSRRGKQLTFL